jgi:hypothetical protein
LIRPWRKSPDLRAGFDPEQRVGRRPFRGPRNQCQGWSLKSTDGLDRNEDYGLFQAHEMLGIVAGFIGVDAQNAFARPLIQNTLIALATGQEYSDPHPGGCSR